MAPLPWAFAASMQACTAAVSSVVLSAVAPKSRTASKTFGLVQGVSRRKLRSGSASTGVRCPFGTSVMREFGPGSTTRLVPGELLLLTIKRFWSSLGLFRQRGGVADGGLVNVQSKIVVGPRWPIWMAPSEAVQASTRQSWIFIARCPHGMVRKKRLEPCDVQNRSELACDGESCCTSQSRLRKKRLARR